MFGALGCSGELRSFIFYTLSFRLNGNAFPVCAEFAADAEPLAVGDAKLNLWDMSAYHTDPCAL